MKIKATRNTFASGKLLEEGKTYDTDKNEISQDDAELLVRQGKAEEVKGKKD